MVQRCGVGGAQEEEQYLVCSSTKRALALKTQQALTSQHSGEERCRRRPSQVETRVLCVAAGPRSDVRLGDSSWRFRPRAGVLSSMRSTACPRQTLHHARSVASS
jgi:hypothetical protein